MKGRRIPVEDGANSALRSLLGSLLESGKVDAVMAPSRIPSGESFAWLLIRDPELLGKTTPLPPVMPVQGARALSSLGYEAGNPLKMLCVLRPCEARATIELAKRNQVEPDNLVLLTIDCPGAFPTLDYTRSADGFDRKFEEALRGSGQEGWRPDCLACTAFSDREVAPDIHVGRVKGELVVLARTDRGREVLEAAQLAGDDDISDWRAAVDKETGVRKEAKDRAFREMDERTDGADGLDKLLADCINCHNCMRVCPICYCRQCLFDSADAVRIRAEDYLARAKHRGGIRFPGEMMKFHLGRMYHMALSCVACGACEDACPMDVPVSRLFAFVGDRVQADFGYVPGRDREEPMPMTTFEENELHAFEDAGGAE